ncbi:hypothetical protein QTN47_07135 [Danxiaibacter flavus]|uniref:Uncharacterized protein n=1 Tax=Danxiaibacter flavus TaxID=3049108 RepID=A0ABV3ZBM0_9BACT|nr:hypothetical protein QNM32_07135 [Chitinophagaceae bacterium DXS]
MKKDIVISQSAIECLKISLNIEDECLNGYSLYLDFFDIITVLTYVCYSGRGVFPAFFLSKE